MSLITFKLIAAVLIFLVALLAGVLPMYWRHFHSDTHHITDSLTNGIFLGAALFHMLPDAQAGFAEVGLMNYPYAILLCLAGFILLQIVKYATFYFKRNADNSRLNASIVLLILCIHSIIEGTTLGINTTIANALVIFIAIIAHKSCDSFALANTLKRYNILPQYNVAIIILYAFMTPFGILVASSIMSLLANGSATLVESSLNAVAAGTFIYIGALDALVQQFKVKQLKQNMFDFLMLLLGMGFMGLIAIWI
jgi:solute carrier family 39 (zinc transporter), member 1/2/3